MSSVWGNNIKISIFGESHGKAVGVVIDGLPPGEKIDFDDIKLQMQRRCPPSNRFVTQRAEHDIPQILSGVLQGATTGTPLCAVFNNKNAHKSDYKELIFRPGHADYTGYIRYKGNSDFRGGGHFSGRLTCPLVFAGTICRQILKRMGVTIGSHISSVAKICDSSFDPANVSEDVLESLSKDSFPIINSDKKAEMENEVIGAKAEGDSVGGSIECAVVGVRAGIGNPIFDNIESKISSIIFGIPGVKAIEFGSGFASCTMRGSENNDSFVFKENKIQTVTNNHGGILGGISSGMPIVFKVYFKPTPSINKVQKTVDAQDNSEKEVSVSGRHDPCIALRAAPIVESAVAIAILDYFDITTQGR